MYTINIDIRLDIIWVMEKHGYLALSVLPGLPQTIAPHQVTVTGHERRETSAPHQALLPGLGASRKVQLQAS